MICCKATTAMRRGSVTGQTLKETLISDHWTAITAWQTLQLDDDDAVAVAATFDAVGAAATTAAASATVTAAAAAAALARC